MKRFKTWWESRASGESGSAATEVVILVPMAVLMVGFTIMVGRLATTHQDITSASRDGARAAAVRQHPAAASADGTAAVEATLASHGVSCQTLTVDINTAQLQPGGQVSATVTCVIGLSDVVGLGVGGSRTITSTSTAVVDTYRGGDS